MKKYIKYIFLFIIAIILLYLNATIVHAEIVSDTINFDKTSIYYSSNINDYDYNVSLMDKVDYNDNDNNRGFSIIYPLIKSNNLPLPSDPSSVYTYANFIDFYNSNYYTNNYQGVNACNSAIGGGFRGYSCNMTFSFWLDFSYEYYGSIQGHDSTFYIPYSDIEDYYSVVPNLKYYVLTVEQTDFLYTNMQGALYSNGTLIGNSNNLGISVYKVNDSKWEIHYYIRGHDSSTQSPLWGYRGVNFIGGVNNFKFANPYSIRIRPQLQYIDTPNDIPSLKVQFDNNISFKYSNEEGVIPDYPVNDRPPLDTDGYLDNIERALAQEQVDSSRISQVIGNFKNNMPLSNNLSNLFLIIPNFVDLIHTNLSSNNNVCTNYNLGSLYNHNLILPCVSPQNYLGSEIWLMIDLIATGCFLVKIRKVFIRMYKSITFLSVKGLDDDLGNYF